MSDPTSTSVRPEVEAFVAQVRARLGDLGEDEREELLGGLEADLSEQVADGATELGDPWLYAAELRAAAGLPEARRSRVPTPRLRAPRGEDVARGLDGARRRWFAELERHPAGPRAWEVVAALRPAWWVLRAWAAVTLVDTWAGPWERISVIPTLGFALLGPALLAAAVVVSTLIGLGRLWPGSGPDRAWSTRLLLLGANLVALGVLVSVLTAGSPYLSSSQDPFDEYRSSPVARAPTDGLRLDGSLVRNVFAYDAAGDPLSGVQLFRGNGDPLTVSPIHAGSAYPGTRGRSVGCGWVGPDGRVLHHVFPLAEREQQRGYCTTLDGGNPITEATPPFLQVPPAISPLTPAEVVAEPVVPPAAVPSDRPSPGRPGRR